MIVQNSSVATAFNQHSVRRQQLVPLDLGASGVNSSAAKPIDRSPVPAVPVADLPGERQQQAPSPLQGSTLPPTLRLMKLIIEGMLGKQIETHFASGNVQGGEHGVSHAALTVSIPEGESPPVDGAALTYRLRSHESEKATLNIQAELTLDNGRRVSVNLEQSMSRQLDLDVTLSAEQAAKFIDPLVLNFSGPVSLSDRRAEFDVDADGRTDSIAMFASNSAYLALDKNGDGQINDGRELFGALSGDGFADLAQYDDDGNGFIDAGDAVFSQLKLYTPGGPGGGSLRSLDSAGVEAIYTGSMNSPFSLTSASGEVLGQVRSTGFHVGSYGANTAQQIDLAV